MRKSLQTLSFGYKPDIHHRRLFSVLLILFASSCTSLQPVTELSNKSVKALAVYDEIPSTWMSYCEERCEFELIRKNEILRESEIKCDCKLYREADQATGKILRALTAYFKNAGELANAKLADYNTKELATALSEGKFGSLTIDKKTVAAYNALGKLLMRTITDGYRRKQLAKVISEANPEIQSLIPVLQSSVSNLAEEFEFLKERNYLHLKELLLNVSAGHSGMQVSAEYYSRISAIKKRQAQLTAYSKSLKTIADGHQKLYENRNNLKAKEMLAILSEYSTAIEEAITQFKKIS